ncbi:hypothetical protein [Bradyrhizobium sp. SZCCHNR2035]|uniref:hypothetical protein n=1 Tax=Bradyrhizobium sp. SZCCHNR2035 TaxID=3057386 RepID=UPI002916BB1F|nr:hypothetical protein [Bradyrhizobium sp. SZCCHNR2035]
MAGLPASVTQALKDAGHEDTTASIETAYNDLLENRVDFVEYGDPDKLTDKERAKLNCVLLTQVVIHRAERLVVASGQMFESKNLYGLALAVRGHLEAVAVLGYMARRLDSLQKENIDFARFEEDIANGLMGAMDDLFKEAKAPVNILTAVEHADKLFDADLFKEKRQILRELYLWLCEFAHPNFCSKKTAFDLDKDTGRMVLRKVDALTNDHYQMLVTLSMSCDFLQWLIALFDERVAQYFAEEPPQQAAP